MLKSFRFDITDDTTNENTLQRGGKDLSPTVKRNIRMALEGDIFDLRLREETKNVKEKDGK